MSLVETTDKYGSLKLLILSNLVTIIFAVFFNWSIYVIMWGYWCQSVIIGIFNFLRMLTLKNYSTKGLLMNNQPVKPSFRAKLSISFFFLFHYGFFHFGYMVFLAAFSSGQITANDFLAILMITFIFFLNHLFSFIFYRKKQEKQNLGTMLFFPYVRIVPMHLTILFGGIFLGSVVALTPVLVFFLLLKTAADVVMHSIEHGIALPKKISEFR